MYFSQVITLQINTLNLMCSNFWIATKTLFHLNKFLNSLNEVYNVKVKLGQETQTEINKREVQEVHESAHPYLVNEF